MPKSKQSNRGGARKGAGRKPKDFIAQARKPYVLQSAQSAAIRISDSSAGPASEIAPDAYAALRDVVTDSQSPAAARVTAARAIIDLAKAEQSPTAQATGSGKKAQASFAAAQIATGGDEEWGDDLASPVMN